MRVGNFERLEWALEGCDNGLSRYAVGVRIDGDMSILSREGFSDSQVIAAQHELQNAESELIDAKVNQKKSLIELQRSTGTILSKLGISVDEAVSQKAKYIGDTQ
jgi:hypothetical protein